MSPDQPTTHPHCRAPKRGGQQRAHPPARAGVGYDPSRCNAQLTHLPFTVKFTGRFIRRYEDAERSERRVCMPLRCPRCKAIGEYEITRGRPELSDEARHQQQRSAA